MKHISFVLLLFSLATIASAEECIEKAEPFEGKVYNYVTCVARIDDVIKTEVDGYLMIAYVVKYKGQRLVISDHFDDSNLAVGEKISFVVGKLDFPREAHVLRRLFATIVKPLPTAKVSQP